MDLHCLFFLNHDDICGFCVQVFELLPSITRDTKRLEGANGSVTPFNPIEAGLCTVPGTPEAWDGGQPSHPRAMLAQAPSVSARRTIWV